MGIRPLTRSDGNGVPYQRRPEVAQQIAEVLTLGPIELIARAKIPDYRAEGYVKDETLAYFVREFHREGRDDLVDSLADILMQRCGKATRRRLRALSEEQHEEAFAAILLKVFGEQLTDLDSDRGDFLQVSFAFVLDRMAIRAFNDQIAAQKRLADTMPLSVLAGYDPDDDSGEDGHGRRQGTPREAPAAPLLDPERLVLYREGLNQLAGKQREAFILRYYDKWPIDPPKDGGPSLTSHFKTTSRTIRNWFAQSERLLREWADGTKEQRDGNP